MLDLLVRLEVHTSLKDASPGFNLSDEDIDGIVTALRFYEKQHRIHVVCIV